MVVTCITPRPEEPLASTEFGVFGSKVEPVRPVKGWFGCQLFTEFASRPAQFAYLETGPLGLARQKGGVDRHVFERFGRALSSPVINAGVNALTRTPSIKVVGNKSDAGALGTSEFQPTIRPNTKVAWGFLIPISGGRFFDFSPAGAAK